MIMGRNANAYAYAQEDYDEQDYRERYGYSKKLNKPVRGGKRTILDDNSQEQ
jgi:hypothetical protein